MTTTDQVNRKMKRESDTLGRLIKVTEQDSSGSLSQHTSYTYDLLDRLTEVNQGNQLRKYKYDGLGRLLYERIPEQSATINDGTGVMWSCKYTYTSFNAVATKTDARGVMTTYGYDTMNRLTGISYNVSGASGVASTPGVIYQYDNTQSSSTTGLLMSVFVGSGATVAGGSEENYSYDSLGRVSSLQRRINVSPSVIRTYTSSYQYNEAGQVKQITYPSSRVLTPSYDNLGRLNALASYLSSVTYDTLGRVSGMTLGNGVVESYGYDSQRMQMTSQTATRSGNTLMSLTYNFQATAGQMGAGSTAGNAGQLMSVSGSIGGQTESAAYTYDLLGRLVTSNQTTNSVSAQRRFVYDRWGNRTSVYDATTGGNQVQSVSLEQSGGAPTNRITSVTESSTLNYTYDAAGNVTNDGAHSYTYDAENRLVSVDGGATAQYGYDQSNRRIKKTIGGVTTHCVWEGAKVIAENTASSGAVIVEYVYSGSRMIASIAGGVTRYYLADRLSARVTLDTSGNIIGRQAHLPFGEELDATGTTDKHRFTSYERDSETETDQAVNRQYAQGVGRFNRTDPYAGSYDMGDPQSMNRYAYVKNDPINLIDPLGLDYWVYQCAYIIVDISNGDGPPQHVFRIRCEWVLVVNLPPIDTQRRLSYESCRSNLEIDLRSKGRSAVGTPNIHQYLKAAIAADDSQVDLSLLLATWGVENTFVDPPVNNLSGGAYGPMQIQRATAQQYLGGFSLEQVLGNQSSRRFTGDVGANLTVGGRILADLVSRVGGDLALAGTAYLGPNDVIGKTPDQLRGAYRERYKKYQDILPAFQNFTNCVKEWIKQVFGN